MNSSKYLKRFCKECGNVTHMEKHPIEYRIYPGLVGSLMFLIVLSAFLSLALVLR